MFQELIHACHQHPERQLLVDALLFDDGDAVARVLENHEQHEELLEDCFLTPYLMQVVEHGHGRIWKALNGWGYDERTRLIHPDDMNEDSLMGGQGTPVGAWVAMALAPKQIRAFSQMAPRWKPWMQWNSSPGCCVGTLGMVYGDKHTFSYWLNRLTQDVANGDCPPNRKTMILLQTIDAFTSLIASEHTVGQDRVVHQTRRDTCWTILVDALGKTTTPETAISNLLSLRGAVYLPAAREALLFQSGMEWIAGQHPTAKDVAVEGELVDTLNSGLLSGCLRAGWPVIRNEENLLSRLYHRLSQGHRPTLHDIDKWVACWEVITHHLKTRAPTVLQRLRECEPWERQATMAGQWEVVATLLDHGWPTQRAGHESLAPLLLNQSRDVMEKKAWQTAWNAWVNHASRQEKSEVPQICQVSSSALRSGKQMAALTLIEREQLHLALQIAPVHTLPLAATRARL